MKQDHHDQVRAMYQRRAETYDSSHDGWHIDLANSFVDWIDPQPGETALDLACGTGLLALPIARRVGRDGSVIAVDLTDEMMQVGRHKARSQPLDSAEIHWELHDIASSTLLAAPSIKAVLDKSGGFDIITVCSALVLLERQSEAVHFWASRLLKSGGRMIIDVPTEDMTLQFMLTYHLPRALGIGTHLAKGRVWVKGLEGPGSLQQLMEDAGLRTLNNFKFDTASRQDWYRTEDHALTVLEQTVDTMNRSIKEQGKEEAAREVWPRLWKHALDGRGSIGPLSQDHPLYVCMGQKRNVES